MNILVVEDERNLADAIVQILIDDHFNAEAVYDGNAGLTAAQSGLYDAVVLDIMLPGIDGIQIVKELRHSGNSIPVLMLTAKTSTGDMVQGLDAGSDDYMTKPFSPAELLAHLRALTRRQGQVVFERIEAGDLSLNIESRDLSCNGKSIALSFKEFELARILFSNPGQIVSKDTLISKVWGVESTAVDNNVEAYVSFLRKKIRFLGSGVSIDTIRKAGYRVNLGDDDARSA